MPADDALARWGSAFRHGVGLFNEGQFFEAHEVWEALWRCETELVAKRTLQGLIQIAAGYHKYFAQRRPEPAVRLLRRGLEKISACAALAAFPAGPFYQGVSDNIAQLERANGANPLARASVPPLALR